MLVDLNTRMLGSNILDSFIFLNDFQRHNESNLDLEMGETELQHDDLTRDTCCVKEKPSLLQQLEEDGRESQSPIVWKTELWHIDFGWVR